MDLRKASRLLSIFTGIIVGGYGLFLLLGFLGGLLLYRVIMLSPLTLFLFVPLVMGIALIQAGYRVYKEPLKMGVYMVIFGLIFGIIALLFRQYYVLLAALPCLLAGVLAISSYNNVPGQPSYQVVPNNSGWYATPPLPPFIATPSDDPEFKLALNKAISLAQSGQKGEAYQQLRGLAYYHPQEVNLLLWLAFTAPTLDESRYCISQAQRLEPLNPSVAQAIIWLNKQEQVRLNS